MFRCLALFILFAGFAGADVPVNMDFETDAVVDSMPAFWLCEDPDCSCAVDSLVFHGGSFSARFTSELDTDEGYLERTIPFPYTGEMITLSGWFRGEAADSSTSFGIFLLPLDSQGNGFDYESLTFDEFGEDSPWREFTVSMSMMEQCDSLTFGVFTAADR